MRTLLFILLLTAFFHNLYPQQKHLSVSDTIPVINLPEQTGKLFSSVETKGKSIPVVFFYPNDNTNISTNRL